MSTHPKETNRSAAVTINDALTTAVDIDTDEKMVASTSSRNRQERGEDTEHS